MPATIDLTESVALTVLRSFLLSVLPASVEVVKGQDNRVGEPSAAFVVLTPLLRERLETNVVTYQDVPSGGLRNALMPTRFTVQLDIHGAAAGDNAQIIATLIRDGTACDTFADYLSELGFLDTETGQPLTDASGNALQVTAFAEIQPLYAGEPRQVPFITGEKQYEARWIVDVVLQINPTITTPQQFADTVTVGLISVDAVYPP